MNIILLYIFHAYIHTLESEFFVFLWRECVCVCVCVCVGVCVCVCVQGLRDEAVKHFEFERTIHLFYFYSFTSFSLILFVMIYLHMYSIFCDSLVIVIYLVCLCLEWMTVVCLFIHHVYPHTRIPAFVWFCFFDVI